MKKLMIFCIALLLLVCPLQTTFAVGASENTEKSRLISETTEFFHDGTYVTVSVYEEENKERATTTKTGSKVFRAHESDGTVIWTFTVQGTFSVNSGVSSTCTAVSHSHSISANSWSCKTSSSSKSGNTATGTATFVKKILFITTDTKECTVQLTCDKNGNLS